MNFNARLAKHLDERRRNERNAAPVPYRKRRPNETAEAYAEAMARGFVCLSGLMSRARNPQDYD